MTSSILAEKTIDFAISIVKCYGYLLEEKREYVMSKQILRSGTSVGANIHEALFAQSRADFISKLSIALKEASETSYWLTVLQRTEYLTDTMALSLRTDLDEIIRIIISSIKTSKKK